MNHENDLEHYTGVLYLRHKKTGHLARYNVEFVDAELMDGDHDDPKTLWRFELVTTTPIKFVTTAADR